MERRMEETAKALRAAAVELMRCIIADEDEGRAREANPVMAVAMLLDEKAIASDHESDERLSPAGDSQRFDAVANRLTEARVQRIRADPRNGGKKQR